MLAERLAKFAAAPISAAENAGPVLSLSLLDWAACAMAGRAEPVAQVVSDMVTSEGGRPEATLLTGGHAPARAAALVNGAASHALDYDDTHFAHIGHPSVAVVPAALAMAERQSAALEEFRDAVLVGAEASIRVGIWLGRSHYEAGFHQTATAGAFGAAVAAARLMKLPHDQILHAIGLVSTRAAGLKSQFGTMGKPLNAGIAAANGVEAVQLVARGFVSNPAALDGEQGFGPTHHGQANESAFDGLGQRWLFETVSHKFHACCHGLHAMLEALARIEVDADAIEHVAIRAHPRWAKVCNIEKPATGLQAKFSFRLTAAMALSGISTAALEIYSVETASDVQICRLRDRVSVSFDPKLPETACEVEVTASGIVTRASHDLAAPLGLVERSDKLRAKAIALIGAAATAEIDQALDQTSLQRFVQAISANTP